MILSCSRRPCSKLKFSFLHANANVNSCLNILVCSRTPNFSWGWWLHNFYGIKPVCIASVCSAHWVLICMPERILIVSGLCSTSQNILFLRVTKDAVCSLQYKTLIGGDSLFKNLPIHPSVFPPPKLLSVCCGKTREISANSPLNLVTPKALEVKCWGETGTICSAVAFLIKLINLQSLQ